MKSALAVLAALIAPASLLRPAAAATLDLAVTAPEARVHARGASSLGFFADRLTASAAPADLSGDGRPDLILSAWTADGPPLPASPPRPDAGEVHVLFGPIATGSSIDLASIAPDVSVFGARADDFLYAEAGADLSGDGVADLVLSAPRADGPGNARRNSGSVYVLFGPFVSGTTIDLKTKVPDVVIHAARAGDDLNARVPVDLDGDGALDLLMVAAGSDGPLATRSAAGEAFVLRGPFASGTTIDLKTAAPALRVLGVDPGDALSWAVGADFSGDGVLDLALGAFGSAGRGNSRAFAGEVHVLFGPLAGFRDLRAGTDLVIHGDDAEDSLGGVLAAGDLDGDGLADLVAGACCASGPGETRLYAGEAYGFFAPLAPGLRLASAAELRIYGAGEWDSLRYPALGRLNQDECDDLVLGADFASAARPESGAVYVLDGPFTRGQEVDLALDPVDLRVLGAEGAGVGLLGDLLGIVSLGDLTGDGRADLLASAQFADGPGNARPDSGEVYLIEGGCRHLPVPRPRVTGSEETLYCLWPPNHRYACFGKADFHPGIAIDCAAAYTWRLAGCASDQGPGTKPDDCIVEERGEEICVRAERNGGGPGSDDGRRYFVSIIATDACGNDGAPVTIGTILVPHDEPEPGVCRSGDR